MNLQEISHRTAKIRERALRELNDPANDGIEVDIIKRELKFKQEAGREPNFECVVSAQNG